MAKKLTLHRYFHILCVWGILTVATFFRLLLISSHWPFANGDESIINLMALHITYRGENMTFFYGQNYMGSLEAYLCVPFFLLFGPTPFSTHIMLIVLYTGFSLSMYVLTRLLYTKWFALAITILMSLGSGNMLTPHLWATGGYPEIQLFGALLFMLATWLALTAHNIKEDNRFLHKRWQRIALYLIWGLCAGLALWSDLLILPVIVAAGIFLLLFCWREMRFWGSFCLLGGVLLGAAPLIAYNLHAAPGQTSLDVLRTQAAPPWLAFISFFQRITGALVVTEPAVTGANPLCAARAGMTHINSVTDFFTGLNSNPTQCVIGQGLWAFSSIACWIIATLMAGILILKLWQRHLKKVQSAEEQQLFVQQVGRFILLTCAAMIFLAYATSPNPAINPLTTGRYLGCLSIAIPAVLWPLWSVLAMLKHPKVSAKLLPMGSLVVLALIFATYARGTLDLVQQQLPQAQTAYQQRQVFIHKLIDLKVTRFYSEYWTCNNLIFESKEQLICSNLQGKQLAPGQDRYKPYHNMIASTVHPGYVFPLNSDQAQGLEQRRSHMDKHYKRLVFDSYLIYYYPDA